MKNLWRKKGTPKPFHLPTVLKISFIINWFSWIASVCDKQPCDNVIILCMEEIKKGISKLPELLVDQILLWKPLNITISNQNWRR